MIRKFLILIIMAMILIGSVSALDLKRTPVSCVADSAYTPCAAAYDGYIDITDAHRWIAGSGAPHYAVFDLGAFYVINSTHEYSAPNTDNVTYNISYSSDGFVFTELYPTSKAITQVWQNRTPTTPVTARYMKVYITAMQTGGWTQFSEIEFYTENSSATLSPNITSIPAGARVFQPIQFINDGTGIPSTYNWSWGDGTPNSTTASPSHTFNDTGNYNVVLTITNTSGYAASITKSYTVTPLLMTDTKFYMPANGTASETTFVDLGPGNYPLLAYGDTKIKNANNSWRFENASYFDGTGDLIYGSPGAANFGSSYPWSASFWVNSTSSTSWNAVVGTRNRTGRNNGEWVIGTRTSGGNNLLVGTNDLSEVTIIVSVNLNDGAWHYINVQRINATCVEAYTDGVYRGRMIFAAATKFGDPARNLTMGWNGVDNVYYTGYADDILFYNGTIDGTVIPKKQFLSYYSAPSFPPVAAFTASNTTGIYPPSLTVRFNDTSTYSPTSWEWNFTNVTGNNTAVTFSTTQSPLWSFDIGNYSISLKATNADGSDLSDQVTWINVSAPTTLSLAEFTGSPLSGNAPLSVTFTDADGTGETSWGWIFGDGNTTGNTLQNPVHLYTASGVYTVNHSATNAIGTNWSNKTGYITVVNASGFTPQDIWMVGQFLQTFRITDKDTGLPIPVVDLQDTAMQTYTTTNGTGYLTESFGASNVVFISSGYDSKSISYVFDSDETHDVQLTKSTPGGSKNTWYSPHQVRLEVWNSYGNKIEGIAINATANYSSMPDSWITNLYGIDPDVANNMLNKTLIMAASTGSDGAVVFTMHGSISYDVRMTNPVTHTEYFKQIMPKDEQYILRMPTSTVIPNLSGNVYSNIGNTSLTFTEPNTSYVTMGLQYQDTSGTTSSLKFYVYFDNNKTVVYSSDLGNPGTNLVLANYTARNIRGIRYIWNYTAVRT